MNSREFVRVEREFNSEVSQDKNNSEQSSAKAADLKAVERNDSEDIDSIGAIAKGNAQQALRGTVDPSEFEGLLLERLFDQPLIEVKKAQLELTTSYLDIIKNEIIKA